METWYLRVMGRGLLSRLGQPNQRVDKVRSIMEHLRVLLNTRHGESVTVPDYGIADMSDLVHDFPNAVGVVQQQIRQTILAYEPRLKNVSVRFVPSETPLLLNFEIVARLADDRRNIIRMRTSVDGGGRFQITE